MARDSLIIGDLIGDDYDLEGLDDDGDLADLIGDLIGRRGRSRRRRRIQRRGERLGVPAALQAAAARRAELRALNAEAQESREQLTAGHFVADDGQRDLYLPFEDSVTLAAAAGSVATLTINVQRPLVVNRLILECVDGTTRADDLQTVGITSALVGVQPLFNAQGTAPARSFSFNAVGVRLQSMVARVGQVISVTVERQVAGANASTLSGLVIGVSAQY